ncbi:MAG: zinc-binding dehydrogenase [Clostridiales bacterium]|nr:zinc-binding dehydrogenase [Clostridiales bacterium]
MMMKALRKLSAGPGNVELCRIEKPVPDVGEVLIRVEAVGICGTDIKILHGTTWSNPPVTLGHEYAGVIEAIGEGVTALAPGDRVVSETAQVICGTCEFCKTGRELMCDKRLSIGYGVDGAMAEYIVVRQGIVHRIPDRLSFDRAALCEPFAVALHALMDHATVTATTKILVMGPGAIGQLVGQAAKAVGATVVMIGLPQDQERLNIASSVGIDAALPELTEEIIKQWTGGKGFDIAVDCTGAGPAIRQAMAAVKKTGTFIQVGLTRPEMTIEYSLLTGREISILGTFGHQWHNWEMAIRLMADEKVQVAPLITGRYDLEDWEQGFDDMAQSRGIKILLYPNRKKGV